MADPDIREIIKTYSVLAETNMAILANSLYMMRTSRGKIPSLSDIVSEVDFDSEKLEEYISAADLIDHAIVQLIVAEQSIYRGDDAKFKESICDSVKSLDSYFTIMEKYLGQKEELAELFNQAEPLKILPFINLMNATYIATSFMLSEYNGFTAAQRVNFTEKNKIMEKIMDINSTAITKLVESHPKLELYKIDVEFPESDPETTERDVNSYIG